MTLKGHLTSSKMMLADIKLSSPYSNHVSVMLNCRYNLNETYKFSYDS